MNQPRQTTQPEPETVTPPKLAAKVGLRLVSTGFLIYYWIATNATPDELRPSFFYKILLATTAMMTVECACDWLQVFSHVLWYVGHGTEPMTPDELPFGCCIRCLQLPSWLCNFGRFVTHCWITSLVFPLKPCETSDSIPFDTEGCTALHVMSITFVVTLCLIGCTCLCLCGCMLCISSRSQQNSGLARSGSSVLDVVVSPAVRAQFINRLPLSKEPPKDDVCAICQDVGEEGSEWRVLPCRHRFHRECVDDYLRSGGVCPFCRHDFTLGTPVGLESGLVRHQFTPAPAPAPASVPEETHEQVEEGGGAQRLLSAPQVPVVNANAEESTDYHKMDSVV